MADRAATAPRTVAPEVANSRVESAPAGGSGLGTGSDLSVRMLFDLAFDDEPTLVLVRDESVARAAEPPALPFPLVREKADPEPDVAVVFELVSRVRSAAACA